MPQGGAGGAVQETSAVEKLEHLVVEQRQLVAEMEGTVSAIHKALFGPEPKGEGGGEDEKATEPEGFFDKTSFSIRRNTRMLVGLVGPLSDIFRELGAER